MTKNPEHEEGYRWNPLEEEREWSAAANESDCHKIARRKGKKLVQIIQQSDQPILSFICILEDYPDE